MEYTWRITDEINRYPSSPPATTVPAMFLETVAKFGDRVALRKEEQSWTFHQYADNVRRTALAFINLGLQPLAGVGIIGFNSPEWFYSYYGSMFAGGVAVGIYSTNNAASCAYVIKDAGCEIVVAMDDRQSEKILSQAGHFPQMKALVQYEGAVDALKEKYPHVQFPVLTWAELMETYGTAAAAADQLKQRTEALSPYKCCTIVYTSGTTGMPKGAMLTHANINSTIEGIIYSAQHVTNKEDNVLVSYLPLSHILAQVTDIGSMFKIGGTVVFARPDALKGSLSATIAQACPTLFVGVPRVYEKIQASMEAFLSKQYGLISWALRSAFSIVLQANLNAMEGKPPPLGVHSARTLVYMVKRQSGLHRIALAISGGAPLLEDTQNFWLRLDIPIIQGYGLSEVSGGHTAQTGIEKYSDLVNFSIGSIGKALNPAWKTRIDPETSEIQLAGENIFSGYLNREEATKEAFIKVDDTLYFRTGDQGRMDERGDLWITGRLKELIITAGGENVPPVPIEEAIKRNADSLISNVLVVGDKRKFLACFVTLKCTLEMIDGQEWPSDNLSSWTVKCLEKSGVTGITTVSAAKNNPEVRNQIEAAIKKYNKTEAVSTAQYVQKFDILDKDFSIAGGDLGPTLKLKRNVVVEKLKDEIEKFYAE